MKISVYPSGFLGLCLLGSSYVAEAVDIGNIHYPTKAEHHFVQLDVSHSPKHRVFVAENHSHLVIDIKNASVTQDLAQPPADHPLFAKVHTAVKNGSDLRIVLDLKQTVDGKHFALRSNNRNEHQLLVDLASKATAPASDNQQVRDEEAKTVSPSPAPAQKNKAIIIAIDAGHGGTDPGAHGQQGTEEKVVTLAIAKKLEQLINQTHGMKALMIRKGDYYVDLRERMEKARAANADLFISIHADAYQDPTVTGASVFTLSKHGASSEAARWLADNENAAQAKLGNIDLVTTEKNVATILLDLSQSVSQEASVEVANQVLKSFHDVCGLHRTEVQNAGFMVLKSPDIPSILVETAFISNPDEEKNLLSSNYQSKMATAIFNGVRDYFKKNKPSDSKVATL
ncbi:N-acetylmuramoyl-L-alanine amidase [Methylosoma difficile]